MPRILEEHQLIAVESIARTRCHMHRYRPRRNSRYYRRPTLPPGTHTPAPRRFLRAARRHLPHFNFIRHGPKGSEQSHTIGSCRGYPLRIVERPKPVSCPRLKLPAFCPKRPLFPYLNFFLFFPSLLLALFLRHNPQHENAPRPALPNRYSTRYFRSEHPTRSSVSRPITTHRPARQRPRLPPHPRRKILPDARRRH